MTHLGDRVTDLVDGQLAPEATETAHAHLAGCTSCREAVEAERLMKSRLASLAGPGPSDDLVGRLLAIGGGAALAAREAAEADRTRTTSDDVPAELADAYLPPWESDRGHAGGRVVRAAAASSVPGRPTSARPSAGRPTGRPDGVRPGTGRLRPMRRRRLAAAVVGALSMVGVGTAGLTFSVTALSPGTVLPPVATFVVEHAAVTGGLPFVDVPGLRDDTDDPDPGTP